MFRHWFSRSRPEEPLFDGLYGTIAAAARQTGLYEDAGVPDTPLGRFEMIALHLALVVRELRSREGEAAASASQEITDRFFRDVDNAQRELGIGDEGMRHRMKRMGRMYYGRLQSYGEALDHADRPTLVEALRRNALAGAVSSDATLLAAYTVTAATTLERTSTDGLVAGAIDWPDASVVLSDARGPLGVTGATTQEKEGQP